MEEPNFKVGSRSDWTFLEKLFRLEKKTRQIGEKDLWRRRPVGEVLQIGRKRPIREVLQMENRGGYFRDRVLGVCWNGIVSTQFLMELVFHHLTE